eukprot:6193004-Pleurochrysis_carterae.AAC.11
MHAACKLRGRAGCFRCKTHHACIRRCYEIHACAQSNGPARALRRPFLRCEVVVIRTCVGTRDQACTGEKHARQSCGTAGSHTAHGVDMSRHEA